MDNQRRPHHLYLYLTGQDYGMSVLEGVTLLLLEDDDIDARAFERMLASQEAQIHCVICQTIADALVALTLQQFDLIVADYRIHSDTMLELMPLARSVPVIVVTGAGDEEIAVQLLKAGISDYVVKDLKGQYLKKLPHIMETALSQQRLKAAAQEAHRFSVALADSALAMSSTLDLNHVLERILHNLSSVIPHDRASLILIEANHLAFLQGSGYSSETLDYLTQTHLNENDDFREMLSTRQPIVRHQRQGMLPYPSEIEKAIAYMGVPLIIEDRVIGLLNVERLTDHPFTLADTERLTAFAAHAALATNNARLYRKAQELATIEERQRLARDLHDSVTQTLFSAATIADATQRLWTKDPTSIGTELQDLRELTQGALAEMRTLLFELRPDGISETSLARMLRHLVTTLAGRAQLQVQLNLPADTHYPLPVKTALFRIAQEALNNIVKHARAKHVEVTLKETNAEAELMISDDGMGFDSSQPPMATLGLRIMQERASAVNIGLTIESQPHKGTKIVALWPATSYEMEPERE